MTLTFSLCRAAAIGAFALLSSTLQAQTRRPPITGVSHLAVYSTDMAKTERFYAHDLGAARRSDPQQTGGVRFYFNPVQFVEVLPLPADAAPKLRFDHAAYNTANAEQMRLYLAEHSVAVPAAVTHGFDGASFFEVKDPEGNRIQFVQPPLHPAAVAHNALSAHIIHLGYIVHNRAAEDAFYRNILGFRLYWEGGATDGEHTWVSLQVPDGHDWIEYMIVPGPDTSGIPASMSQEVAGILDHFSLGVANIERATTLLYAGDRLNARHSDPKIGRDGKWQLNLYDPDGIRAEVMELQPAARPCCSPFLLPSPTR